MSGDGDERRTLPEARRDLRTHVLDPDLRDVPLREHHDRRALRLARHVRDREVLVDDALARVHEHERDVGALGGLERAELRVVLDPLTLPALPAQAGGVDEHEGRLVATQHGIDRVPGRAGNLGHDHPLAPHERVQERRLPDVRSPEDRDLDRLLADRPLAPPRKPRDDLVEQVTRAVPVQRGDRDGIAEAEPVELEGLEVAPRVVELVRKHEHGAPRQAQDLS